MEASTRFTTAAIGLMHIINHFNEEFILSKENEFKIWHSSVNLPTRSTSIYGLAAFAKEQGVEVKIIIQEHEYSFPIENMPQNKKEEIENARFSSFLHQKKARESGIEMEEKDFNFEDVKDVLKKQKVILLRLNKQAFFGYRSEPTYFAVLGYDEENSKFLIIDPKQGQTEVAEEKMYEAFETLKTKCRRDNRMIVLG